MGRASSLKRRMNSKKLSFHHDFNPIVYMQPLPCWCGMKHIYTPEGMQSSMRPGSAEEHFQEVVTNCKPSKEDMLIIMLYEEGS